MGRGDYSVTVASPDRFVQDGPAISEYVRLTHRWYNDSDNLRDGFSWRPTSNQTTQPNIDDETHSDDTSSHARQLLPSLVTSDRTVYRYVGTINDLTDIDHFKVKSPSTFQGALEMTVDIEPLKVEGLVPDAEILASDGSVLLTETRVRGYGQFQIALLNPPTNREFVVRVKGKTLGDAQKVGNFSMTVTFTSPATPAEVFLSGNLSLESPVVEREWYVARPQLFALSLGWDGFERNLGLAGLGERLRRTDAIGFGIGSTPG